MLCSAERGYRQVIYVVIFIFITVILYDIIFSDAYRGIEITKRFFN